ncbi:hypothetical protein FJ05194_4140 [Mycobacterium tuberculosis FJ05194]|nr:hypothetical protein FJ05194_4140 [Mycobacterium tuberculosis FJ05194]
MTGTGNGGSSTSEVKHMAFIAVNGLSCAWGMREFLAEWKWITIGMW